MRGRVRWGNVGRVAGAAVVVALVVAWPRLGGDPIVAPGGEIVPFATPDPPAPPRSAPRSRVVPTPTATARGGEARKPAATAQVREAREKPARSRRVRRPKPRDAAPPAGNPAPPARPTAPAPPAPTPAAPPPPAPTIDPAEREFGFER